VKQGDKVEIDSEAWKVVGVGATAGKRTYVHLAHTTRGTQGRAGFIPIQSCGWFDGAKLHDRAAE